MAVKNGTMDKQTLLQKVADRNYEHGTIEKNGGVVTVQEEYGGQYDDAKGN